MLSGYRLNLFLVESPPPYPFCWLGTLMLALDPDNPPVLLVLLPPEPLLIVWCAHVEYGCWKFAPLLMLLSSMELRWMVGLSAPALPALELRALLLWTMCVGGSSRCPLPSQEPLSALFLTMLYWLLLCPAL